uniref:Uncharacterized protein n=1 Tax=Arundo donax TaxID=35708 RepID=A0A0A8YNV3_ARUDO
MLNLRDSLIERRRFRIITIQFLTRWVISLYICTRSAFLAVHIINFVGTAVLVDLVSSTFT